MIHTLTLNPAIDKILYISSFNKNETNRIREITHTVGGKGTHVSMNLACLGETSNVFGICYGSTGQKIIDLLEQHALRVCFVHNSNHESRTNYLLVEDNGDSTLVTEQGVPLEAPDIEELFGRVNEAVGRGEPFVISGDASNCCGSQLYDRLHNLCHSKSPRIYLDTSGETLGQYLRLQPYLIKPNLEELSELCRRPVVMDEEDICRAISSLPHFIPIVAVTLGGEGAIVKVEQTFYRVHSPKVAAVNTVGCGDCYMAGLVYGTSKGLPIEDILRLSTAMAGAAAESRTSVCFNPQRMKELMPLVNIRKIE